MHPYENTPRYSGDWKRKVLMLQSSLTVDRYRLTLTFSEGVCLPEQPLVTLRGLLGHGLLGRLHPGVAEEADLPADSDYWAFFKPTEQQPQPFLLDCAPGRGNGQVLRARVTFWGTGERAVEPVLASLAAMGPSGFGPARVPFTLEATSLAEEIPPWRTQPTAPPGLAPFRFDFISPARLKEGGGLVGPDCDLLRVVCFGTVRRLKSLAQAFGGDVTLDLEALRQALAASRVTRTALTVSQDRRISSRSGAEVTIGGLSGFFEGEAPAGLRQVLQCAAWTGIGGKIATGCGRVRCTLI